VPHFMPPRAGKAIYEISPGHVRNISPGSETWRGPGGAGLRL